jgi:hypothetical protein
VFGGDKRLRTGAYLCILVLGVFVWLRSDETPNHSIPQAVTADLNVLLQGYQGNAQTLAGAVQGLII